MHNNGSITLSSALDYEAIHKYTFLVKSRDNGIPNLFGSAMVTINVLDVNDNAPTFTGVCNNTVSEASPVGMVVVICKAMDQDARDTLIYRLNSSDHFSVDNNGAITLKKNLDYQVAPVHNLLLIVSDSVHQINISVRITVTQSYLCRPAFNQSLYEKSIKEDSHVTTYVLTVRASDARNRTITYSLQSIVTDFQIDSTTGKNAYPLFHLAIVFAICSRTVRFTSSTFALIALSYSLFGATLLQLTCFSYRSNYDCQAPKLPFEKSVRVQGDSHSWSKCRGEYCTNPHY